MEFLFSFGFFVVLGLITVVEFFVVRLGYERFVFLRWLLKPFLMVFLVVFWVFWVDLVFIDLLVVLALVFALFGDVFLLFSGRDFLLYGLSMFLVTHLMYILFFVFSCDVGFLDVSPLRYLLFAPPVVYFVGFVFPRIRGGVEDVFPVGLYVFVILSMVCVAGLRLPGESVFSLSVLLVYVGGFLFVFSDSLIGLERFGGVWGLEPVVIFSYGLGQFLIVFGLGLA